MYVVKSCSEYSTSDKTAANEHLLYPRHLKSNYNPDGEPNEDITVHQNKHTFKVNVKIK